MGVSLLNFFLFSILLCYYNYPPPPPSMSLFFFFFSKRQMKRNKQEMNNNIERNASIKQSSSSSTFFIIKRSSNFKIITNGRWSHTFLVHPHLYFLFISHQIYTNTIIRVVKRSSRISNGYLYKIFQVFRYRTEFFYR